MSIDWRDFYHAALLESDWTKIEGQIQTAESEIYKRRVVLSQDHGGTQEERDALVSAMSGLKVLRKDVTAWLERQHDRGVQS
jgi:hypothetical protein